MHGWIWTAVGKQLWVGRWGFALCRKYPDLADAGYGVCTYIALPFVTFIGERVPEQALSGFS